MTKQEPIRQLDESGLVRKEVYYEPKYVELEKKRFWPRVWQMACRAEEIPNVGDYITYEIYDESVVVIRSAPDRINAFYNVCRHRGRRLTEGCGQADRIRCPFHGWQWDLNGENVGVTGREEFGSTLDGQDLSLKPVKCDTWGGWVWINFDPNCEPLESWLEPVGKILAPFELEKMRYRWRKWMVIPCNWKIGLEAFNEGYHVGVTHFRLHQYGAVSPFVSATHGRHSTFASVASETGTLGVNASRDGAKIDSRKQLADFYGYMKGALDSNMTDTILHAAKRLPNEVPEDASPGDVINSLMMFAIQQDAERGVVWPNISMEEYQKAGIDWHIFPNMVLLPMATNCLGYRARPYGDDPDKCIFEVYHIERFPEGQEPKVENLRNDDVYDEAFWGDILLQDFQQMQGTHQGVKSASFERPKLNPQNEAPIANFHRQYHELISKE